MSDKDFLKHIEEVTGSKTLCLAKWYNATIWLGSGQTTSCHHPPAHAINLSDVNDNPKAIHNTDEKKQDRFEMQCGDRPEGCDYCWKIEDMDTDQVSDRVYKSKIYDDEALSTAGKLDASADVNLKTLEISFDRTCNFACSYCNPAFSTSWVKDIKQNGPYNGLKSDGRNHFTHAHDASQLYKYGEENPFTEAFMEWWATDLKDSLQEIRVTGGEPLMSPDFWRFLNFYDQVGPMTTGEFVSDTEMMYNDRPKLAINTNLGCSEEIFDKFTSELSNIENVDVYTSCEATFEQAEYIRDGLDYDLWLARVDELIGDRLVDGGLHVMATINALSLFSLTDFLNQMLAFKAKYGKDALSFTLNIMRFPSFQSCLVLPDSIKKSRRQDLQLWLWKHATNELLHTHELQHVERLIEYLNEQPLEDIDLLRHDFKSFYQQYDQRRSKRFEQTFPEELVQWYKTI